MLTAGFRIWLYDLAETNPAPVVPKLFSVMDLFDDLDEGCGPLIKAVLRSLYEKRLLSAWGYIIMRVSWNLSCNKLTLHNNQTI